MKKLLFITTSLFLFLMVAVSCTEKENLIEKAKPGSYTIEKMVNAIKSETESRGINNTNTDFDVVYDPDYIYLHIVGSTDFVYIPLYTVQCDAETQCKCFSYHIDILENGDALLTPYIDNNGKLASESLEIPNGSNCYFSSVEESVWKLTDEQIYHKTDLVLYRKEDNINKEIYRSIENFSITQLTNPTDDLLMGRACAAFTVVGVFYDAEQMNNNPFMQIVPFNNEKFKSVMGSYPDKWYMKIYCGGKPFVSGYDLGTEEIYSNDSSNDFGYYCTGPFVTNDENRDNSNHQFVKFTSSYQGISTYFVESWGYNSQIGNNLLTPVLNRTDSPINVYIMIKHWEGEGEPDLNWLISDDDALYTRMNITGEIYPFNNCFYNLGLIMDIRQFKKAWDEAQSSRASQSRSANGPYYFELKDAKVICETY